MSAIQITRGTNATINGIRCQLVADAALHRARYNATGPFDDLSVDETLIAKRAARVFVRLKGKGYGIEHVRLGFWNRIVDEAQRVKTTEQAVNG